MSPMTKVLMPLTTPPISPLPEDTRPEPKISWQNLQRRRTNRPRGCLAPDPSGFAPAAEDMLPGPSSCSRSRSRAEGIWRTMVITASAMPGPITLLASVKTPRTASNVSTRARGRRKFCSAAAVWIQVSFNGPHRYIQNKGQRSAQKEGTENAKQPAQSCRSRSQVLKGTVKKPRRRTPPPAAPRSSVYSIPLYDVPFGGS